MREIALDTETTGLDPNSGHRIVEIGCVEMFNRVRTGEHYHVYINPERDMPEEAFRVHGLSIDFLRDKPKFVEVAEDFVNFIGDSPLVIHNAGFDMRFINAELKKVNRAEIPFERAVDTVVMARKRFPGSPANLDALCKRFNIDLSSRTLHGALLDAQLLADVYLELMGGRQSALSLKAQGEDALSLQHQKHDFPRRDFPLSEEEQKAHEEFLKKIKNAMWVNAG